LYATPAPRSRPFPGDRDDVPGNPNTRVESPWILCIEYVRVWGALAWGAWRWALRPPEPVVLADS